MIGSLMQVRTRFLCCLAFVDKPGLTKQTGHNRFCIYAVFALLQFVPVPSELFQENLVLEIAQLRSGLRTTLNLSKATALGSLIITEYSTR